MQSYALMRNPIGLSSIQDFIKVFMVGEMADLSLTDSNNIC